MPNRIRLWFYGLLTLLLLPGLWIMLPSGRAAAQSTGFLGYVLGLQVVNLADANNPCRLTSIDPDGISAAPTVTQIAPPLGSVTFFPLTFDPALPTSFAADCDLEYATIANLMADDLSTGGAYAMPTQGAFRVDLPLLFGGNNGFASWYSVQNLGDEPATVQTTYSDGMQADVTIPPGAIAPIIQQDEAHSALIFAGSLVSSQPVRVAVMLEDTYAIFAYTGLGEPDEDSTVQDLRSTRPVFPLINVGGGLGLVTGLQIMNVGNEGTEVTVAYTPSTRGTSCTETRTVAAASSATFALEAFATGDSSNCSGGTSFVGSAAVVENSAGQPLIGIANQLAPDLFGETYVGFAPELATNVVALPLIMDRNGGFFTGFSVQHIGGPASPVSCTFSDSTYTVAANLAAGEALVDVQEGELSAGYVGSARCTAEDPTARIVAVVNQFGTLVEASQLLVYEGIPIKGDAP